MTKEQILILVAMCAYVALMIVVGLIYAKRNKNASDYLLGGRRLGPWMTAMSAEASDMSGWLLNGAAGARISDGYRRGVLDGPWPRGRNVSELAFCR